MGACVAKSKSEIPDDDVSDDELNQIENNDELNENEDNEPNEHVNEAAIYDDFLSDNGLLINPLFAQLAFGYIRIELEDKYHLFLPLEIKDIIYTYFGTKLYAKATNEIWYESSIVISRYMIKNAHGAKIKYHLDNGIGIEHLH